MWYDFCEKKFFFFFFFREVEVEIGGGGGQEVFLGLVIVFKNLWFVKKAENKSVTCDRGLVCDGQIKNSVICEFAK